MNPPGKKNKIPYFHILFFHIRIKVVRVCVVLILYWHISDEHDDDMNSDYQYVGNDDVDDDDHKITCTLSIVALKVTHNSRHFLFFPDTTVRQQITSDR